MLGQDLVGEARRTRHQVTAWSRSALDVTDPAAAKSALESARPEVVFNCAAWTDVDGAENAETAALEVNEKGAAIVAAAAAAVQARVVYLSSDYVFDGLKREPYVESDGTAPLSAYGRTKLAGEEATAVANPDHLIVRSAWLFGPGGGNFVETMLALGEEQQEVLVVRDQVGSPTYTGHLAEAIVRLLEGDAEPGIHHLAGGGQCSWFEFADEIFDQTGTDCRVISTTSKEIARPAPRPAYSALATERPAAITLPNWREGLAAYLAERSKPGARAA
jgi:dTDP-4-dehydrorhamnose reductase